MIRFITLNVIVVVVVIVITVTVVTVKHKQRLFLVKRSNIKTFLYLIYKIFGAMVKDSYGQISEYFGIPSVEQLIRNRHDRFTQ